MKKILLSLAAIALLFSSCKKDYTCSCKTTTISSGFGGGTTSISSNDVTFNDVSRQFIKNKTECYSTERSYTSQYPTGDFDPVTGELIYATVTTTRTTECTLDKK